MRFSPPPQVLQGLIDSIGDNEFLLGRFMELSHSLGWSTPTNAALGISSTALPGLPAPSTDSLPILCTTVDLPAVLSSLNERLSVLHAALPPLTALIVFTGHGDPQAMVRLSAKKSKFDRLWKTVKQSEIEAADRWMESDERALADEVERCRSGLSFYCMK